DAPEGMRGAIAGEDPARATVDGRDELGRVVELPVGHGVLLHDVVPGRSTADNLDGEVVAAPRAPAVGHRVAGGGTLVGDGGQLVRPPTGSSPAPAPTGGSSRPPRRDARSSRRASRP